MSPTQDAVHHFCSIPQNVWTRRWEEEAAQGAQEGRQGHGRGGPQVQAETEVRLYSCTKSDDLIFMDPE